MLAVEEILETLNNLRQEYLCPITNQAIKEAVIDCQGISYEKQHIQKWLQKSNTSPLTGQVLSSKILIPNYYLQNLIKKVQTQLPVLFSYIDVIKNQLNHVKLQNQKLQLQIQLNQNLKQNQKEDQGKQVLFKVDNEKMVSQVQQRHRQPGIKEMVKKIINSKNSHLKHQDVSKKFEKQDQYQNQNNQSLKLSKRKFIKKVNFQRFYDTKMTEHLKQTQKRWQTFASNLKTQHKQILNKFVDSLKLKQDIIQRQKCIIKDQSNKITQLNNMINEKKASPFSVLKKIQDLGKQVKGFFIEHRNEEAEKLKANIKFNSYQTQTEVISQNVEKMNKTNKLSQSKVNECCNKEHELLKYELGRSFDLQLQLRRQLREYRQKSANYQEPLNMNPIQFSKIKFGLYNRMDQKQTQAKTLKQQLGNKNREIKQLQKKLSIAYDRAEKQIQKYDQFIFQLAVNHHYQYREKLNQINRNNNENNSDQKSQQLQELMEEILEKNQIHFRQFKISKTRQQLNQQIVKLNDKILQHIQNKQQLELSYSILFEQKRFIAQSLQISQMARSKLKITVKQLEKQVQNYKKITPIQKLS